MLTNDQLNAVADRFETRFGLPPQQLAFAPGRVNLLGEHTDYNGGFVLPMALRDLGVAVAVDASGVPGEIQIASMTLDDSVTRRIDDPPSKDWSDYAVGSFGAFAADKISETGLRAVLRTSLPLGAGLSSSAALEVACLNAVTRLFDIPKTPVAIAIAAQSVENNFVGMPCGIMDQFASSVGDPGAALFLDTRSLEYVIAPGLPGHTFIVIDSGVSHQLTDGGYATRVAECKAACDQLNVACLSDLGISDEARIRKLQAPLDRRAWHIVTDNRLAQEGLAKLKAADATAFGRLMTESHATARDNFEITVPETDALVEAALSAGALGARQTGGGWGGAIVALVSDALVQEVCDHLTTNFKASKVLALT